MLSSVARPSGSTLTIGLLSMLIYGDCQGNIPPSGSGEYHLLIIVGSSVDSEYKVSSSSNSYILPLFKLTITDPILCRLSLPNTSVYFPLDRVKISPFFPMLSNGFTCA